MTALRPRPRLRSPRLPHVSAGQLLTGLGAALVLAAAVLVIAGVFRSSHAAAQPGFVSAPGSDEPPLEYIYLDAARVNSYLGQVQDGLSNSVQRTESRTEAISAGLSAGALAQVSGSQSSQEGSQETLVATAADSFYKLLRLLRKGEDRSCPRGAGGRPPGRCGVDYCPTQADDNWLGDVNDLPTQRVQKKLIDKYLSCIGVGSFIRLTHVQLFLPPFAQVLPNAQSANVVYGGEPWRRRAFASPTQSTDPKAIAAYAHTVGPDPRMPFVAAPYGSSDVMGPGAIPAGLPASTHHDVTFFLPADYLDLTSEPSLLTGSVTVVGKVIYAALNGGPAYIDYPTISEFAPALLKAHQAFSDRLGVCSQTPPKAVLATAKTPRRTHHHAPAAHGKPSAATPPAAERAARSGCYDPQAILHAVKSSVTLKPPFVVILPLAIYE